MAERDPLEDLTALWRRVEAPAPDSDDSQLEAESAAALAWVRAAWSRLEAPAARPPRGRLVRADGRWYAGRRLVVLGTAIAACALVLLVLLPRAARDGGEAANDGTELAAGATQASEDAQGRAVLVPEQRIETAPLVAAYTPNALELRSGSVRLILLDGPTDFALEDLTDDINPAGRQDR